MNEPRREVLIDAAARQARREAFLGSGKDRERAAKSLIRRGSGAGDSDVEAVLEHVRKVPLPFLQLLAERGATIVIVRGSVAERWPELKKVRPPGHPPKSTWSNVRTAFDPAEREIVIATGAGGRGPKKLAPPPGSLLLREIGAAIDQLLGRARAKSLDTEEIVAAWRAEEPKLDGFHAEILEETFADLFSKFFRGDRSNFSLLPQLWAAWEKNYDRWIKEEEARSHPARLQRVTKFLRQHVLANSALTDAARQFLAEMSRTERGPWDRTDAERHLKAVKQDGSRVLIETRWGVVPYSLDASDGEERRQRCESFLEKFVKNSTRMSPESRARLEKEVFETYGPWCAVDFADHVRAVIESRGRLMVKSAQGDSPLEAW